MFRKVVKFVSLLIIVFGLIYLIEQFQQSKINNNYVETETEKNERLVNKAPAEADNFQEKGALDSDYKEKLEKEYSVEKYAIPLKQGIKRVKFDWNFRQNTYELEDVLYDSTYNFYRSQPKVFKYKGDLPQNWENEYYGIFLKTANNDTSIQDFTILLQNLAKKNNLNENQTVEMIVSFIQDIPYDHQKADEIMKGLTNIKPRYPYEVLYDNLGVCSGKSFLMVGILRELGYGAALLEYDKQNHMAVGIQCPKDYSIEKSGYCYIETTSTGHIIGIVPELNLEDNVAVARTEKEHAGEGDMIDEKNLVKPDDVRIFQKTTGKEYTGIEQTVATLNQIEELEKTLSTVKTDLKNSKDKITQYKKEIAEMDKVMEEYEEKGQNRKYNDLIPDYNKLVNDLKAEVDFHNTLVGSYNKKVDEYNNLIQQFK